MKTWSAIIIAGSLLTAYTMNSSNGIGSKIAEAQAKIAERHAERVYAATNGTLSNTFIDTNSVNNYVESLKSMIPAGCEDGSLYLERIQSITAPALSDPNKNIVITQRVNRLCGTSISLPTK